MKTRRARIHPTEPIKAMPSVTAGLNRPPDTRKKTHAFTARLNPKANAMYESEAVLGACDIPPSPDEAPSVLAALAT